MCISTAAMLLLKTFMDLQQALTFNLYYERTYIVLEGQYNKSALHPTSVKDVQFMPCEPSCRMYPEESSLNGDRVYQSNA